MLPGKLDQIAKDFKLKNRKTDFPYKFVNENNLNYIGPTPNSSYFKTPPTFVSNWDLKKETLSYLENDINLLEQIMISFGRYIGEKVSLDITNHLTIASLAYRVYFS